MPLLFLSAPVLAAPAGTALAEWRAGVADQQSVPPAPAEAWLHFRESCERGLVPACFAKADLAKALGSALVPALESSCNAGSVVACDALAVSRAGDDNTELDRLCESGSAVACRVAGRARFDGTERSADVHGAIERFGRACDLGSGLACQRLFVLYAEGVGAVRDASASAAWATKSCALLAETGCRPDTTDPAVPELRQRTVEPGSFQVARHEERASYCLVGAEVDARGEVVRTLAIDCDRLLAPTVAQASEWHFTPPEVGAAPLYAVVPVFFAR